MNDNKALERAEIIAALEAIEVGGVSGKYHGPYLFRMRDALTDAAALLEHAAEPPNDPLTLEELRGMDGEPVRIEENGEYQYGLVSLSGCAFTPKDEVITLCNGDFYLLAEMEGNYKVYPIAYRRKPDGGVE